MSDLTVPIDLAARIEEDLDPKFNREITSVTRDGSELHVVSAIGAGFIVTITRCEEDHT